MSDTPTISTTLKVGKFTFTVLAYRTLTKEELMLALSLYMRQKHLRSVPKSGAVTFYTTFGFDG